MVKIGNIELGDFPLLLAPMEDVSDPPFRALCKELGADLMYSEFISTEGLIRDAAKSVEKLDIYPEERPVGIQIFGAVLESMIRSAEIVEQANPEFISTEGLIRDAAKSVEKLDIYPEERPVGIQIFGAVLESMIRSAEIVEQANPELLDINFGCPVKKVVSKGAGAGILQNIPLMVELTKAVVDATKLPVTVKTRLGWDENSMGIVDTAERLQDVGIQAISIHGRTRKQMYKGEADWRLIAEVKNNPRMNIPVFGNGDIDTPEKALEYKERYGVDGVMIGRAAIGYPWIFNEIKHYRDTGTHLPPPTIEERVRVVKRHLELSLDWKGERRGIVEMRRHYTNYFKGIGHFKDTRKILVTSENPNELFDTLEDIRERSLKGELEMMRTL